MADDIYRFHCESVSCATTDDVVGYAALRSLCKDICKDDASFDIAIMELCRRKLCSIVTDNDGEKAGGDHSSFLCLKIQVHYIAHILNLVLIIDE